MTQILKHIDIFIFTSKNLLRKIQNQQYLSPLDFLASKRFFEAQSRNLRKTKQRKPQPLITNNLFAHKPLTLHSTHTKVYHPRN